jgi:hypothetical protein
LYGKLFASMYGGTLYGHWEAIVTMQQLVVLADADGIVDMTPQAIAAHTSIPLDIIAKGISKLEESDPYSRTPGEDGRRIVCIDEHRPWGWQIVNYLKYKHLKDSDEVRAQNRVRAQRFRDKRNGASRFVTPGNAESRHTDTDIDIELHRPKSYPDAFEVLWKAYPKRIGGNPKDKAYSAYRSRLAEEHPAAEILDGVSRYARYCELTGKVGTEFVMQTKTFLGPSLNFKEPWETEAAQGPVKYDA